MAQPIPMQIEKSQVHISQIQVPLTIVDTSGALDLIQQWRAEDKAQKEAKLGYAPHAGGRPSIITDRAAIALMLAIGVEANPLLVSRATELVTERITEKAWEALKLPTNEFKKRFTKREVRMWYHRIWRAIGRVLDVVDPYPETSYYKRMEKSEYAQIVATRDPALIEKRQARAHILMNKLVWASVEHFGEDRLADWKGDLTIDGTPMKITRYGRSDRSTREPSDPDTGWHVREKEDNHAGPASLPGNGAFSHDEKKSHKRFQYTWAHELTLSAMWGGGFGQGKYPSLVTGVAFDKPSSRVAENGLRSIDHLIDNPVIPRGTVVTDRAYYPNAKPEKWGIPLREAGYKLLGDFKTGENAGYYGVQGTEGGAVLIDGSWFCPSILKNEEFVNARQLRDKGRDLKAKDGITQERFEEIVEKRAPLALKIKDISKTTGNVRLECPAKGICPSVSCKIAKKIPSKRKDVRKSKKPLFPVLSSTVPKGPDRGKICEQGSITVPLWSEKKTGGDKRSVRGCADSPVETYARFEQFGPLYGSQEWKKTFGFARNVIETRNAILKGDDGMRLGSTKARLMRGWIKKFFLAAVGVTAMNLRLIQSWIAGERDLIDGGGRGPGGPGGRPKKERKKFRKRVADIASGNDPPAKVA